MWVSKSVARMFVRRLSTSAPCAVCGENTLTVCTCGKPVHTKCVKAEHATHIALGASPAILLGKRNKAEE